METEVKTHTLVIKILGLVATCALKKRLILTHMEQNNYLTKQ